MTVSLGATAAATVAARGIGFARGVVLAWLIPMEQFGLLGVALLVMNVLLPVCSGGLYEGVARYSPIHEATGTLRSFLWRAMGMALGLALVVTVVLATLAPDLGAFLFGGAGSVAGTQTGGAGDADLLRAVLLAVGALTLFQTFLGMLKGLRLFRALGVAELVSSATFALLAVGAATAGFATARAIILAYAAACVIPVAILGPSLLAYARRAAGSVSPHGSSATPRQEPLRLDERKVSLSTYSLWCAGVAIVWHAMAYYPMWHLLKVTDAQTVGAFHALRIVTQLLHVFAAMVTGVVAANLTRQWEHEGPELATPRLRTLTKVAMVGTLVAATLLLLAKPLVACAFPQAFSIGLIAYEPLVFFFVTVSMVGLVVVRINLVKRPAWALAAWLVGAGVNVAMCQHWLGAVTQTTSLLAADALHAAAWAGVIGAGAALAVTIAGASAVRLGLGLPTLGLMLVEASIMGGWRWAVPATLIVIILAIATPIIFSQSERASLLGRWASLNRGA